jgi:ubiquinone/menaquinone biosynthesis C-methylase UbiE
MPTPEDVKARVAAAYNQAADHYDHSGNAFWDRFGRRTVEKLALPRGARVLDVCCGAGASAIPAAAAVGEEGGVVAIDLADGLLRLGRAKAEARGLHNIEFRGGDALALDLPKESFDAVICVFGIFFVPDMTAAVREMWSFLKPGGRLAITTWGAGLFEPANSAFWASVRTARPELYKSFSPWDRLGETRLVEELFLSAGIQGARIALEPGRHPMRDEADVVALLMGTGYRGIMDQLTEEHRAQVRRDVAKAVLESRVSSIAADVIYAAASKPA